MEALRQWAMVGGSTTSSTKRSWTWLTTPWTEQRRKVRDPLIESQPVMAEGQ